MSYINVDQHRKKIRNRHGNEFAVNCFATGAGMVVWMLLLSLMGWAAVESAPSSKPYLSYPEKSALLKYSKENMAKADRAFIDEMEIIGQMKTERLSRR